jgi:hypothetical protein
MFAAKRNYEIEKNEMLAIIESCRVFQHYVKEALFLIQMLIDHVNLNSFFENKELNKKKHDDERNSMIWIFTSNINRVN